MSLEEYFDDWLKVIDKKTLYKTINILNTIDSSTLCPNYNNIFNCFTVCKLLLLVIKEKHLIKIYHHPYKL